MIDNITLSFGGDRTDDVTVSLPAVPRVGENVIYTHPPSRDVWVSRTLIWTVAKVVYDTGRDEGHRVTGRDLAPSPPRVLVILADGVLLHEDDED